MIYLDSAATSMQKPAAVSRAVLQAMGSMASPGRGGHPPALRAADCLFQCRLLAAELFHVEDPEQVVFTFNASHGLNLAIHSLIRPGQRVLMSGFEHNSVSRPLLASGAQVHTVGRTLFDPARVLQDFENGLPHADAAVCTHVSNVFGFILPIYEIAELCRRRGVPLIVDASQSAGVLELDMQRLGAAFIAMPGHKGLLGPQGTGLLLCNHRCLPLLHGGSGSDSRSPHMPDYLPDRLEAGTHNVPGIAGLKVGMEFIKSRGVSRICRHEQDRMRQLANALRDTELELFEGEEQTGVLSLRCPDVDGENLARKLGESGVCVRAGLHCAPTAHKSAGTLETGTVRFSFSPFVSAEQVEQTARICRRILREFHK